MLDGHLDAHAPILTKKEGSGKRKLPAILLAGVVTAITMGGIAALMAENQKNPNVTEFEAGVVKNTTALNGPGPH